MADRDSSYGGRAREKRNAQAAAVCFLLPDSPFSGEEQRVFEREKR